MNEQRASWGSRFAFIMAAAGSAIGLGNIWRYPYITYDNGGGKFVLVNLLCILIVGLPVMIGELLVGRSTQKSTVSAIEKISGKQSKWRFMGFLGVAASFVIMSFYIVVSGWVLYYIYLSLTNSFQGLNQEALGKLFGAVATNPGLNLICSASFLFLCIAIVLGGVEKGIEKYSKILMPLLFFILIFLLISSFFLPNDGFSKALSFLVNPSTELKGEAIMEALGNAFFSLSLGMGAMITYGSYLKKDTNLVSAALWVAVLDTLIALIASIVIFSILFAYDGKITQSTGLVFQAMPLQFTKMYGGYFISIAFFFLLFFAALTSAISLLEVAAAFLVDSGWKRTKATWIMGLGIWVFSLPCALSFSKIWTDFSAYWFPSEALPETMKTIAPTFFGLKSFFDLMDNLSANWMLPIGGLLISLYAGFILKEKFRHEEFCNGLDFSPNIYSLWLFSVRFVAPIVIVFVMMNKIGIIETKTINHWFESAFGKPSTIQIRAE